MKAEIYRVGDGDFQSLLAMPLCADKPLQACVRLSYTVWAGTFNDKIACVWGIILPTLLSNQAYLWLRVDEEAIGSNQFLFVRHSQRVIEGLLKDYPVIVGQTVIGADKSIRWLKWLGAKFGEPNGKLVPFTIRSQNG